MSGFDMSPARPDGATFHDCDVCHGKGEVMDPNNDDVWTECPECDGTGEWFE